MWSLLPLRISLFFRCAPGSSIPEPGYMAVFFWALMMPTAVWQKPPIEDAADWGVSTELWQKVLNLVLCLCLVPVVFERECKPTEWSLGPGMVWYQVLCVLHFFRYSQDDKMTSSYSQTFDVKHTFRKRSFIGRTSDIITKMTSRTITLITENIAGPQKPPHNPLNGPLFLSSAPLVFFLNINKKVTLLKCKQYKSSVYVWIIHVRAAFSSNHVSIKSVIRQLQCSNSHAKMWNSCLLPHCLINK